jgi:hypothetical protein
MNHIEYRRLAQLEAAGIQVRMRVQAEVWRSAHQASFVEAVEAVVLLCD